MTTDLARHKMRVGGKMATWPMRPIWQTCRDRHAVQSSVTTEVFLNQTLSELKSLRNEATKLGMETSDLDEVILTLSHADGSDLIQSVNIAYEAKYRSSDDYTEKRCPYEETGDESMCKTCPVGKTALGKLQNRRKQERGREE